MTTIRDVTFALEQLAPLALAEPWDKVGLLCGDATAEVQRVMTCLGVTQVTAAEAISQKADLIVTHHPLPFRPVERLTDHTTAGRLLWELAGAKVAVYSAHTAWDSAANGINQRLAEGLGLRGIVPLVPRDGRLGTGRWGWLPEALTLSELGTRLREFLGLTRLQAVGPPGRLLRTVAVACGAADDLLAEAVRTGCDALLLGEARFHTCLEAEAASMALLIPGHFASERFSMVALAELVAAQFPQIQVWASREERDPIRTI